MVRPGLQTIEFHARERVRGFREIGRELHRSRRVPITETAPGNYFVTADRVAPVTFRLRVKITDTTPVGALFHFGTAAHAIVAWVAAAGSVSAAAGNLNSGSLQDDAVKATATFSLVAGNELDIAVGCVPGGGILGLWVNGRLTRAESVSAALLGGAWAASAGVGEFGIALSAPPTFVPAASRVAPDKFVIVEPLSVYQRQKPRELFVVRVGAAPAVPALALATDAGEPILAQPSGDYILKQP